MWSRQLEAQQMAEKLKDLAQDKLVGEDVAQMVLTNDKDN